jgi:redox-sensitive bicupin YhaK (pirin superfamily)
MPPVFGYLKVSNFGDEKHSNNNVINNTVIVPVTATVCPHPHTGVNYIWGLLQGERANDF